MITSTREAASSTVRKAPVRPRRGAPAPSSGGGARFGATFRGAQPNRATTSEKATTVRIVEPRRRNTRGTIGQRRIGRTGDGEPRRSRQTGRMRSAGFLSERQRRFAWVGFLLAAVQAPVAAKVIDDASWLFAVVVALCVATVILADDAQ